MLAVLPALAVFSTGMFLSFFPVHFPSSSNVFGAGDTVSGAQGGLFFLVNYFRVQNSLDYYASYWSLALSVAVLFAVLFLPYVYLVVKGFFRDRILSFWTGLLLVGSFSCLVVPFAALQYWHRWMFMLVYPFTFYAVYGLSKIVPKLSHRITSGASWFSNKKATAMVALTFLLGVAYLASPTLMVYANTSVPSVSDTYLYFSNSPTVPYQDVNSVVQAMGWLNNTMNGASCVILAACVSVLGRVISGQVSRDCDFRD